MKCKTKHVKLIRKTYFTDADIKRKEIIQEKNMHFCCSFLNPQSGYIK